MKPTGIHIVKGFFLLLLTAAILLSSAGIYIVSHQVPKETVSKEKSSSHSKEEKVSAAPGFEAVVVSFISPDFAKEILFSFFDFSPVVEKITLTTSRPVISEKYFRTLFTHFISPNAP